MTIAPLTFAQGRREPARQLQRREEIDLQHLAPGVDIAVEAAQPFLERRLRRHAGIVDQGVQRPAVQHLVGRLDEMGDALGIAQVGRNMPGPLGIALAGLRHVLA